MQKPEASIRCLPCALSTLFFKILSLNCLAGVGGKQAPGVSLCMIPAPRVVIDISGFYEGAGIGNVAPCVFAGGILPIDPLPRASIHMTS